MQIKEIIQTKLVQILEEWGMMMVDPVAPEGPFFAPDQPLYLSHLSFRGVVDGEYQVVCQEPFAQALARNLLGTDEQLEPAAIEDVLKELVNVLSGNLLTESYGADTVFDLTPPRVDMVSSEVLPDFFSSPCFVCAADGAPVALRFYLGAIHAD